MSNANPPEPSPAATGTFWTPKAVGFRWVASRSSPEFRAGPSGLWQLAQLISSQARARSLSVPLFGSSQAASRGASLGDAPDQRPATAPVGELILRPVAISEISVEVVRLRTDR